MLKRFQFKRFDEEFYLRRDDGDYHEAGFEFLCRNILIQLFPELEDVRNRACLWIEIADDAKAIDDSFVYFEHDGTSTIRLDVGIDWGDIWVDGDRCRPYEGELIPITDQMNDAITEEYPYQTDLWFRIKYRKNKRWQGVTIP